MYTTLDTIPDNVKASLDKNMQKQWVSVYNNTIKKGGTHRNAIFKAWDSVKDDPSCRYFAGFVSTNRIDKQNDSVDVNGAFKKISAFIERGGFITDTHSNRLVGSFYNAELRKSPSGSDGVYAYGVIFRGEPYFDSTWNAIKKSAECPSCHDVRKGTSIGGFALDTKMACNGSQCHRDILDLSIHEISVCQDPANPDAIIDQFNRFAKSDSTIPDGSDVMKKALVEERFVEEPVGEAPIKSEQEMIDAANMGASEAEGMIQEEAGGPAPEGLAGATQALNDANSASTEEGRVPTVEEIKEFKMQLKNIDKLIREISSIRDIIDGAEGGTDGLEAGGTPGGAPEGGATEVTNKSSSEFYKGGANGRETWEEAGFTDDFPKDREGGIGPSRYNRMRAENAKRDKPANVAGGVASYGLKQIGNMLDVARDPTKAPSVAAGVTGDMADAAQRTGLKMDYERWRKGEKNPNGALNDVPDAPGTKKKGAPTGQGRSTQVDPLVIPTSGTTSAQKVPAPNINANEGYGNMNAERTSDEVEDKSKTGETSFSNGSNVTYSFVDPNEYQVLNSSASKLDKGCGCGMDKEIHTGIEEKCKMPKELYGDEGDQQKTKYVNHKDAEAEKYPEADKDAGLVGAPELKGKKTAQAGPAVEVKVVKKLPAEEFTRSNNIKSHIKSDIKEEEKIMNIASNMKKEDVEELEKCKSSKEFLSKYGPKDHPEQNNSSKGTRIKGMGNEGKEIFMKAVEDAFDELNGDEEMPKEDDDVDNFVEGAEEAVEEHEQEEIMTAQELIAMVLGFLKEKGIELDLGQTPLDNPQIEDEIEKEPGVTDEEIEIISNSPQLMEECECLGKMAMYKFNARFTENRINLMDNKILERLEKADPIDTIKHEMEHAEQYKKKEVKDKPSLVEKDKMFAEGDPSKSVYANKKKIKKTLTDLEFCEELVKVFELKKYEESDLRDEMSSHSHAPSIRPKSNEVDAVNAVQPQSATKPANITPPTPQEPQQNKLVTAKPNIEPIFPGLAPSQTRNPTTKVDIPKTPKNEFGTMYSDGNGGATTTYTIHLPEEQSYTFNGVSNDVYPSAPSVKKPAQPKKGPNLYQRARNIKRKAFKAPGRAAKKVGDWKNRVTAEYPGYEASFSALESINHYNEIRKTISMIQIEKLNVNDDKWAKYADPEEERIKWNKMKEEEDKAIEDEKRREKEESEYWSKTPLDEDEPVHRGRRR